MPTLPSSSHPTNSDSWIHTTLVHIRWWGSGTCTCMKTWVTITHSHCVIDDNKHHSPLYDACSVGCRRLNRSSQQSVTLVHIRWWGLENIHTRRMKTCVTITHSSCVIDDSKHHSPLYDACSVGCRRSDDSVGCRRSNDSVGCRRLNRSSQQSVCATPASKRKKINLESAVKQEKMSNHF